MEQREYEIAVRRTLPDLGRTANFSHMVMGILTEMDEYNNNTSHLNREEELGDILWYVYNLSYFESIVLTNYSRLSPHQLSVSGYITNGYQQLADILYKTSNRNISPLYSAEKVTLLLLDIAKKYLAYGKEPDRTFVRTCLEIIQLAVHKEALGMAIYMGSAYDKVIAKLMKRFPDKFDPEKAINRDTDAEIKAMLDTGHTTELPG